MQPNTGLTEPFDLGTWLGRHQAFAWIANNCAAADAVALREIRRRKLYRSLGLTWKDFTARYAGMDQKTANDIIQRLAEFGVTWFELSRLIHITPEEYRELESCIEQGTLLADGERIPITEDRTLDLMRAVNALREKSRIQKWELEAVRRATCRVPLYQRFTECLNDLAERAQAVDEKEELCDLVGWLHESLDPIVEKFRPPKS